MQGRETQKVYQTAPMCWTGEHWVLSSPWLHALSWQRVVAEGATGVLVLKIGVSPGHASRCVCVLVPFHHPGPSSTWLLVLETLECLEMSGGSKACATIKYVPTCLAVVCRCGGVSVSTSSARLRTVFCYVFYAFPFFVMLR